MISKQKRKNLIELCLKSAEKIAADELFKIRLEKFRRFMIGD